MVSVGVSCRVSFVFITPWTIFPLMFPWHMGARTASVLAVSLETVSREGLGKARGAEENAVMNRWKPLPRASLLRDLAGPYRRVPS